MKKLLSLFLVVVLLAGMVPAALADGEPIDETPVEEIIDEALGEPIDEPAEEIPEEPAADPAGEPAEEEAEEITDGPAEEAEDETPIEVPVEEPEEEPAADGAAISVSGTLNAYQFSDNAELELKGDTKLTINADKTIKRIFGDYALTITVESGKTLTVNNTSGHAIDVKSLTVNGPGTLRVTGSKDGLNTDKDISITGVYLDVTAGTDCLYSDNGDITVNCNASLRSTGGRAVFAPWGKITLDGELTAVTIDDDAPCIQSGGTQGSYFHTGEIIFQKGTFTVNAKSAAVYSMWGDITVSGNLKATSSEGIAILSNRVTNVDNAPTGTITIDDATVEAKGANYGIRCAGNIVIMDSNVTASGASYAIYAEKGFTVSSMLSVLTPGISQIKGSTIVNSYGDPATTVVIGPPRITGTAKMTYPGDRVYVGDTVSLELTAIPEVKACHFSSSLYPLLSCT